MSDYFVYIISHRTKRERGDGPVKVGITKSLGSRLTSLQTGNWRQLRIAHCFNLGSRELAAEAERLFHEDMAECRMAGEWFGMTAEDALNTLCALVFDLIDRHYPEEIRQQVRVESGALDALYELTDGWGVFNEQ